MIYFKCRCGRDRMVLDLQLPVQSVPITTKVVSSNPTHGKVYSILHFVIKFVSDLWQVGDFLRRLRFPPPIISYTRSLHCTRLETWRSQTHPYHNVKTWICAWFDHVQAVHCITIYLNVRISLYLWPDGSVFTYCRVWSRHPMLIQIMIARFNISNLKNIYNLPSHSLPQNPEQHFPISMVRLHKSWHPKISFLILQDLTWRKPLTVPTGHLARKIKLHGRHGVSTLITLLSLQKWSPLLYLIKNHKYIIKYCKIL